MENIREKIAEIITHTHKTPLEQADEILLLFSVMQAEGSDGVSGSAVGSSAVGKGVRGGLKCKHCGRKNDSCFLPHLCPSR